MNDRQRVYNELVCCRKFARKYPLPAFQDMPRPPFYSKDIHDLFADAYKFLGKASFGERCTLLCEHLGRKGGPPLMGECFLFLNHYLQTLPQEGEVIEITHALRIIGSIWGGPRASLAAATAAYSAQPKAKMDVLKTCGCCKEVVDGSKRCSRRKKIYYCNAGCQKKAWGKHKIVCPPEAASS